MAQMVLGALALLLPAAADHGRFDSHYALGDAAPLCWMLDARHTRIPCPVGLDIEWDLDRRPPEHIAVGDEVPIRIHMTVTMDTMVELQMRGMLPGNRTAAEQWDLCTQPGLKCPHDAGPLDCCFHHVNIHSCLDQPGSFCGPWVADDGLLATSSTVQMGHAGPSGKVSFNMVMRLFWDGGYTIIAHVRMAEIQWAIGTKSTVTYFPDRCPFPQVVAQHGGCEACPVGMQPVTHHDSRLLPDTAWPPHFSQNPYCVACPAGRYSEHGTGCRPCGKGQFQNATGQGHCELCRPGTSAVFGGQSECGVCPEGSFQSQPGASACRKCPKGAVCERGLVSGFYDNSMAQPGYFQIEEDTFMECLVPAACLGYKDGCAEGMRGPLCNICKEGYTRWFQGGVCTSCPPVALNVTMILLLAIMFVFCTSTLVQFKVVAGSSRPQVNSIVIKIVFNYIFMARMSMKFLECGLLDSIHSKTVTVLGVDVTPGRVFVSLECLLGMDKTSYQVAEMLGALSLIPLASAFGWSIMVIMHMVFRWQMPSGFRGRLRKMVPVATIIGFVAHPFITESFVRLFMRCIKVDVWRLETNMDVECQSDVHGELLKLGCTGLVLWSFGLPATSFFVLWHHRKRLQKPHIRQMLGFLYNDFDNRHWYYECVIMLRKVALIIAASLPAAERQGHIVRLLFIGCTSIMVHYRTKPFDNRSWGLLDHLESRNLAAFIVTLMCALMIDEEDSEVARWAAGFAVICAHASYIGLVLWSLLRPKLVKVLRERWPNSKVLKKLFRFVRIAMGSLRLRADGTMDIRGLGKRERHHLGKLLGNVLMEVYEGRRRALREQHVAQLLQVAVARIMRRRADEARAKAGTPKSQRLWEMCASKVFNRIRMLQNGSKTNPMTVETTTISLAAAQGKAFCLMQWQPPHSLSPDFSIEELEEAFLDVVDYISSGTLLFDDDTEELEDEQPSIKYKDVSVQLSRAQSELTPKVTPRPHLPTLLFDPGQMRAMSPPKRSPHTPASQSTNSAAARERAAEVAKQSEDLESGLQSARSGGDATSEILAFIRAEERAVREHLSFLIPDLSPLDGEARRGA